MQPQGPYGPPNGPQPGPYPGPSGQPPYGQPQPGPYNSPAPALPGQPFGAPQNPNAYQQAPQQPYTAQPGAAFTPNPVGPGMPNNQFQQPYPGQPYQPGAAPQPGGYQQPPAGFRPRGPQAVPTPAAPTTPYDFFMKPQRNNRPAGKIGGLIPPAKAGNKKVRIAMVAGGLIGLLVIFSIVQALLPKDSSGQELIGIAQAQTEAIRVSDLGNKADASDIRFWAINSNLSLTSDKNALLSYMQKNHFTYSAKALSATHNAKTDQSLKDATSSSTYDSTFKPLYLAQLHSYLTLLKQRQVNSTGPNEQKLLASCIDHVNLLLQQAGEKTE